MYVYVLNRDGRPLMPCKPAKARHLLRDGRASVVQRTPFTIRLNWNCEDHVQPITLGMDPGYEYIGLSAVTDKREVYASETRLRTDIPGLLSERRQYRRTRRGRKTRYRMPRFDNRGRTEGWLAPSIRHKLDTMIKLVEEVASILPVKKVNVEVASFDIQLIKNPSIEGEEYQNGEQKGFSNVHEYVLHRDGHTCRHCKGRSKDRVLQTHHIESRRTGGNRPGNLLTVCKTCHDKHNQGKITITTKPPQGYRPETYMTMIRWRLVDLLQEKGYEVAVTYGYLTKQRRYELGLPKSHVNDAYAIAGGNGQERLNTHYYQKQVRRQNRKLHKGARSHIRNTAERIIKGYRRFDKVLYEGAECFIWGRRRTGYFHLKNLTGDTVHASASWKKLQLLETARTILTEVKNGRLPPTPSEGVSSPS